MSQSILDKANANMLRLFPNRHTKPITMGEIGLVYGRNILSINADSKTKKGIKKGYLTGILYLAPHNLSGINLCPMASKGCKAACLFSAGRGQFYSTTRQRVIKTLAYHFDRLRFVETVKRSIRSLIVKAKNKGLTPTVRLNGTSDIQWTKTTDILKVFSDLQFYDYTKITNRFLSDLPENYHLTFSLTENNDADAALVLSMGHNIAAVFSGGLPDTFMGYPVVNGDETDLRFLDQRGVVAGLKAKGKAKKDRSGFVRQNTNTAIAA